MSWEREQVSRPVAMRYKISVGSSKKAILLLGGGGGTSGVNKQGGWVLKLYVLCDWPTHAFVSSYGG
jgi:hypothetical protein